MTAARLADADHADAQGSMTAQGIARIDAKMKSPATPRGFEIG